MNNVFLWDISRSNYFRADRIRNFTIEVVGIETSSRGRQGFKVVAWFSDTETLTLGELDTHEEAVEYVEGIPVKMEEK